MHEYSSHIQYEGEAQGLYVVTHECNIPYSPCSHNVAIAVQECCLSLTTRPAACSSQLHHRATYIFINTGKNSQNKILFQQDEVATLAKISGYTIYHF